MKEKIIKIYKKPGFHLAVVFCAAIGGLIQAWPAIVIPMLYLLGFAVNYGSDKK